MSPSSSDTLDIGPIRHSQPADGSAARPQQAAAEPVRQTDAEAARARIAAMADDTFHTPTLAAAGPSLQTDKTVLAAQAAEAPLTVLAPPRNFRERLNPKRVPEKLRPVLTAAVVFVGLLLALKSPILVGQLQYTFNKPDTAAIEASQATAVSQEPTLSIPKIGVNAPIVFEPSIEEANVQKALENGIVHYGNTPVPGTGGNAVLFGHSSNDWWEPGNYKFIFGLLEKVTVGDQFTADYKGVRYTYEVTGTKTVAPTDVSVLNPTAEPTMTLITCTPVGTSLNRFVVTAKQISPAPSAVAAAPEQTGSATSTLPGESVGGQGGIGEFFSKLLAIFGVGSDDATPAASTPASLPAAK